MSLRSPTSKCQTDKLASIPRTRDPLTHSWGPVMYCTLLPMTPCFPWSESGFGVSRGDTLFMPRPEGQGRAVRLVNRSWGNLSNLDGIYAQAWSWWNEMVRQGKDIYARASTCGLRTATWNTLHTSGQGFTQPVSDRTMIFALEDSRAWF